MVANTREDFVADMQMRVVVKARKWKTNLTRLVGWQGEHFVAAEVAGGAS